MTTPFWIFIFILALGATVAASQLFSAQAEKLVKKTSLSPFFKDVVIATFLVALPELFISIFATTQDYSSMVPTYVTGANLINLLLIPGIIALGAGSLTVSKDNVLKQLPLLFSSVILVMVLSFDGEISLWEGAVLLLAFVAFVAAKRSEYREGLWERLEHWFSFGKNRGTVVPLIFWLLVLCAGTYFTVTGVVTISETENFNPGYLASSIVALAVSIPELVFAYRAVKKGRGDSAVNVLITSTIINSTLVLALPALIKPLNVLDDVVSISNLFLLLASLLFSLTLIKRSWTRYEGAALILIYLVFLVQFLNPLFS